MLTFEQILDQVSELPVEQQELLIDILKHRTSYERRKALATSSQAALEEFKIGNLKPLTATEAIAELKDFLDSPEV